MLGCVAKHLFCFFMIVHVRLAVTQTAVRIMELFAVSYAKRDVCVRSLGVAGVSCVCVGVGVTQGLQVITVARSKIRFATIASIC